MFQNFLKTAFRNLARYKGYALLNISGLALGIGCSLVIFLLVQFHVGVDQFHKNADRVCRVVTRLHFDEDMATPGVPNPFGQAFKNDFPDVRAVSHARYRPGTIITVGGQNGATPVKFKEDDAVCQVDPSFFQMFDYQWLKGSPADLEAPNTAALTEKMARKYFGNTDPVGQSFLYNNAREIKVIGVLADRRPDTDQKTEVFMSYATYLAGNPTDKDHWTGVGSNNQVYFMLPEGMSAAQVQAQLPAFAQKYIQPDPQKYEFVVQPLGELHFNTEFNGVAPKSIIAALGLVGLFLLLTACINFVNLATAQAMHRAKEVGIRKVVGSGRGLVFAQFMAETFFIVLLATVLGVLLAQLSLPYARTLTQTDIFIRPGDLRFWAFLGGLMTLATFLAGAYPALIISGFRPAVVIKGGADQRAMGGYNVRRALVVAQFAVCQLLIIASLVMGRQMDFIKNADLGFNPMAVINVPLPETDKAQTLGGQMRQIAGVNKISFNDGPPAFGNNNTSNCRFDTHEKDEPWMVQTKPGDDQFVQVFDLQLVAGRNVLPADSLRETLLTETAVRKLGLTKPEDALGKRFQIWGKWTEVVGVVKDFHTQSLQEAITPTVIIPSPNSYSNISLKIDLDRKDAVIKSVEAIWDRAFPKHFFEYDFADAQVAQFYEMEDVLLRLVRFFCGVAIFIACLGLYGLVSYLALRKRKEIGVRKVLGASSGSIVAIFGKEFGLLLLLGFVLAAPLGYWAMRGWLDEYVYRIPLSTGIFLAAIGFAGLVALLTVTWQSLRASWTNPVESLKTD